jgi:pyruvate formate lyase activating enzyme
VLDTIRGLRETGVWVEVTTLVIPGLNDSPEELDRIAGFLSGVDVAIPWHVTRFFPDYRLTHHTATPRATLEIARERGMANGLRYVYIGNTGEAGETVCPNCGSVLLRRNGFTTQFGPFRDGKCDTCDFSVDGIWSIAQPAAR